MRIRTYSDRVQRLVCLLYVLRELKGCPTKREVLEYIRGEKLLAISDEDLVPYMSATEERWKTDMAWRRKDGVEWGQVFNNQRNSWEITRTGRDFVDRVQELAKNKRFNVSQCYLWSQKLKKIFDPDYVPSPGDRERPLSMRQQLEIDV